MANAFGQDNPLNAFVPSVQTSNMLAPQTGTSFDPLIQIFGGITRQRQEEAAAAQEAQRQQAVIDLAASQRAEDVAFREKKLDVDTAATQATTARLLQKQQDIADATQKKQDAKDAKEARAIEKSEILKTFPSGKDRSMAVGSVKAHGEALKLLDSITGDPNDPESFGLLSPSTTGISGRIQSFVEPVQAAFGAEGEAPVTRIQDKSKLLMASARRALAGVGASSDRDMKTATEIISSIDWTGTESTIREKLADLRSFLVARNVGAEEIITAHDLAKDRLKALATEARGGAKQTSDTPPVEGAQKAPDGNWYVQQNGQWFKVTN
ncbi:MAG: hypothetical protein GQ474_09745 [Sulfurimonas sp.]|nr:hypothetical protein [Sulfurimonas sp.]